MGASDAPAPLSPADLADDAVRALDVLQAETRLSCVGYLGHSEGGYLALLAANESDADFVISLAGQHQDMETLLYDQSEALIRASGQGDAAVEANRVRQRAVFEAIATAAPGEAPAAIEAALNPATTEFIFFVADGTGGHAFATTLAEHKRNVAVWRRIEANRAAQ